MKLGVNIDHVATLRNARGGVEPDVIKAAEICEANGATSITTHLREDRRHIKDEDVYMNVLCNYLYNRGYDEKGNSGWLETDTVKGACDIFDKDTFETLEIDGEKLFTQDEIDLFSMTDLLFSVKDFDLMEIGMTCEEAHQESSRCLHCDHFGYGCFRGGREAKW